MAICSAIGGPIRDHRIRSADPIGPFPDEAAFSQHVRFSDEPSRRGHKIVFTHADLNPRNILVDRVVSADGSCRWRVSGIVDWETAGYYPEYWDYTKALFEGFRWRPRYLRMVKRVFEEFGGYERELEVERRSWEAGDAV
jgi:thiamine kinase-like enzyme